MYQKLVVVGHLGGDPEMRYVGNDGNVVTNFSMATSRRWTNQSNGEQVSETTWFRVSVWGRQAEACNQYLSKGSKVLVEGRLRSNPETGSPNTYQRKDGTIGTSFELIAESVHFLSSKNEVVDDSVDEYEADIEEDELPF